PRLLHSSPTRRSSDLAVDPGDGERVIGTLRLLFAGRTARIGRVAVERDSRRRGVASGMLEQALARARERGCRQARLAAQLDATEDRKSTRLNSSHVKI